MLLFVDYFAGLISNSTTGSTIIPYAAAQIARHPKKDVLAQLQRDLHITERNFQSLFEKSIGIAPNLYRHVCQFNAAFQQLNNSRFLKLSYIAFEHGCADQNHYIRLQDIFYWPGEVIAYNLVILHVPSKTFL
ncbi:MAG: hypothetical protein ABIX01_00430 [Chitinophagaceae bacterium]